MRGRPLILTRQTTRWLIKAAIVVNLIGVSMVAQTDRSKKEQENLLRIETELVQIDVVVTDKRGNLVRGLRREDFELFEDGKKQSITHFAAGSSTQPASWLSTEKRRPATDRSTLTVPTETAAGRYIVLAVDDFHLSPENLLITKRTLQRFIKEQLVAGDQVAIFTTSGNIGLFQQFTSEREVLERAINRLSVQTRTVTTPFDVPRITDYQAELIDRGDRDAIELAVQEIMVSEQTFTRAAGQGGGGGGGGPQVGRNSQAGQGGQGGSSPRERAAEQARTKARMIVAQNGFNTLATLETLNNIIRSLRPVTGRKMLVLLSDGFFLGGSGSSQTFDLHRITDAATRSGVVIYAIDARGLIATPPGGSASESGGGSVETTLPGVRMRIEQGSIDAVRDGMNALALDTGGFLVLNNNDLNLGLQRVLDDNQVYYVLAYEPPESRRDGRFHKLEVRIADRPELKVRTRKGYLAEKAEKPTDQKDKKNDKTPEQAARQALIVKEAQIRSGLVSLFPLRDVAINLVVEFLDIRDQGPTVVINAYLDAASLNFQQSNGLNLDSLDLTTVIFDEKGKIVHSQNDQLNFNLKPNVLEMAISNGLNYRRLVTMKPGFYQARVAVREEGTARMGSASGWIEVPDLTRKDLTLSSILISPSREDTTVQNANAPSAAAAPSEGYQLRPSTAKRRFKSGSNIDFLVFVYNARADKGATDLVLQSQVFSGSKLVYASPLGKLGLPENADLLRIPYAARVSLAGFEPGEYELRLMAIDRSNKATAHRRVNFRVE